MTESESRLDRIERILAINAEQIQTNTQSIAEEREVNTLAFRELRQSIAEEQRLISDLRAQQAASNERLERVSANIGALTTQVSALTFGLGEFAKDTKSRLERLDMLVENLIRRGDPNPS